MQRQRAPKVTPTGHDGEHPTNSRAAAARGRARQRERPTRRTAQADVHPGVCAVHTHPRRGTRPRGGHGAALSPPDLACDPSATPL